MRLHSRIDDQANTKLQINSNNRSRKNKVAVGEGWLSIVLIKVNVWTVMLLEQKQSGPFTMVTGFLTPLQWPSIVPRILFLSSVPLGTFFVRQIV